MKSVTLWPNDHQQYDWHDKHNKLKQQRWKRSHNTHAHTHALMDVCHISSRQFIFQSHQSKTNRMTVNLVDGNHKTTGAPFWTTNLSELFVIEALCSRNRFSMEDFFCFSRQPLSFYRLVGIFKSEARFVILCHMPLNAVTVCIRLYYISRCRFLKCTTQCTKPYLSLCPLEFFHTFAIALLLTSSTDRFYWNCRCAKGTANLISRSSFLTCIINTYTHSHIREEKRNEKYARLTFALCFDDENWISECDMCVVVWHFNSVVALIPQNKFKLVFSIFHSKFFLGNRRRVIIFEYELNRFV